MECPYCQEFIDDDSAFCEFCGKELVEATRCSSHQDAPPAELGGDETLAPMESWDLQTAAKAMLNKAKQAASPADVDELPATDCPWLHVEYAINRFLMAGAQMPLELRIRIEHEDVQHVMMWFCAVIGGKQEFHRIETEELAFSRLIPLVVPYYLSDASIGGMLNAKFYFGCVLANKIVFHQMDVRHTIYTKGQSAQSIIANISASDGSVVDLGSLKTMASHAHNGDALIERANREPAKFKPMPLTPTAWRPERLLIEGQTYQVDTITLEHAGHLYHICGKFSVKIGRKAGQNDLVVRAGDRSLNETEWPNNTVSRTHAQIHYCGDTVNIIDTSSYGIFINGIKPEIGGNAGVPLPSEAEIRMGDISFQLDTQYCEQRPFDPICQNCLSDRVKCLALHNKEHCTETQLMVWQCCDLGYFNRALEGFRVIRRNGGFILRTPTGKLMHAVPGMNVSENEAALMIKHYA